MLFFIGDIVIMKFPSLLPYWLCSARHSGTTLAPDLRSLRQEDQLSPSVEPVSLTLAWAAYQDFVSKSKQNKTKQKTSETY
jgi:hypothetical protein